jgi:tetratricopeptide (TPR) repeat protein
LNREQFRTRVHEGTGEVLFHDEGLTCSVAVTRGRDLTRLSVNGKPDASVPSDLPNPFPSAVKVEPPQGDLATQVMLAQLPLLLAPSRDDVLVIGFGSGVTLGSVLTHPVKHASCLELEGAVIRGSRYFERYNREPLKDPRTRLVVNDARNQLLVSAQQYDVIISEPSNPWIPGAANLFTHEFFDLGKSRLRPEGLFCLWVQMYEIQPEHFQLILRTFAASFPEVHLFRQGLDAIVVGSQKPLAIDVARMRDRMAGPVLEVMKRIQHPRVEDVLAHYWIGGKELRREVASGEWNTDDNRLVEFAAPLRVLVKGGGEMTSPEVPRMFTGKTTGLVTHVTGSESPADSAFWLRVSESAWRMGLVAETLRYARKSLQLQATPEAVRAASLAMERQGEGKAALELVEKHQSAFPESTTLLQARTELLAGAGRWASARQSAERWLQLNPADSRGRYFFAVSAYHLKAPDEALAALENLKSWLWEDKDFRELPWYLGTLYWQNGRWSEAIPCLEVYLQREPRHVQARLQLVDSLQRTGRESEAIGECLALSQVSGALADQVLRTGVHSLQTGDFKSASAQLQRAAQLKPWDVDIALRLAYSLEEQGDLKGATQVLERFLVKMPDRAPVVGYLGHLLARQNMKDRADVLSARYRVLTGESWDVK